MPRLRAQRPSSPLPPFTLGEERKSQATGPVQWFIWYLNKRAHAALVPSPSFFTGPLRLFMGKEALVNYRDGRIRNGYNSLSWYRRHVRFIHLVYLLLFLFPSSICFDVNGILLGIFLLHYTRILRSSIIRNPFECVSKCSFHVSSITTNKLCTYIYIYMKDISFIAECNSM